MSDFQERLRREDAAIAADNNRASAKRSAELQRVAAAIPQIEKGWADLASYLANQGVRTFQYRHYLFYYRNRLKSHYMPRSPVGFVMGTSDGSRSNAARDYGRKRHGVSRKASRNLTSLSLLLPDGRRWYHTPKLVSGGDPWQGFEELTPESLLRGDLGRYRIDEAGNILCNKGYGETEPFANYLSGLARLMRSPEHYAWLWQQAAKASRKARNLPIGRPRAQTADKIALAESMRAGGEPVPVIAETLGVSRATLYRTLAERDTNR